MHDLDPSQKSCATDGQQLMKIGEDVREELDYKPGQFIVSRHITPKYACSSCHVGVQKSSEPKRIIPGSYASSGVLAQLIYNKYVNHLPLYRQEQDFERSRVFLSRTTMAEWIMKAGKAVIPVLNLIKERILESDYLQCDETPVQILHHGKVSESKKSYMWVMATPSRYRHRLIFYELGPRRSGETASRILEDFRGLLQTDGLKSYDHLYPSQAGKRLGCMAHVRRQFITFLKTISEKNRASHPAFKIVGLIGQLYKIEQSIRENPKDFPTPDDVVRLRQEKSKPIFEELEALVVNESLTTSSVSAYGIGLQYALGEFPKIKLYLEFGQCEIDNNFVENKIRPFALGRKNWLFSDTTNGADASAAFYTLVQNALLYALDPTQYLKLIFDQLPGMKTVEEIETLLPWNVAKN